MKAKPVLYRAAMILLACVFASGAYMLLRYWNDGRRNEKTVDAMLEIVERAAPSIAEWEAEEEASYENLFIALREINPEVTAWLIVGDGAISYPVVKGADNVKYLGTGPDGRKNGHGAIFMDFRNGAFTDFNTVLYGHNMKYGTMFGSLSEKGPALLRDGGSVLTLSEKGLQTWKVISAREISADSDAELYMIEYGEAQLAALNAAASKTGQTAITRGDKILTLSTCADRVGDQYKLRYIVQARLDSE